MSRNVLKNMANQLSDFFVLSYGRFVQNFPVFSPTKNGKKKVSEDAQCSETIFEFFFRVIFILLVMVYFVFYLRNVFRT